MVEALVKKYRVSESLEALRMADLKMSFETKTMYKLIKQLKKISVHGLKIIRAIQTTYASKPFKKKLPRAMLKGISDMLKKAKVLLSKMKISTLEQEEVFLLRLGMKSCDVQEVMGVSKSWFARHRPHDLRRHRMKVDIGTVVLKLEQMLRKEGRL